MHHRLAYLSDQHFSFRPHLDAAIKNAQSVTLCAGTRSGVLGHAGGFGDSDSFGSSKIGSAIQAPGGLCRKVIKMVAGTSKRLALRSVALLLAGLSVIGCGGSGATPRGLIAVRQPDPPNSGSADARLQGTLTYADGCTYLVATGTGPVRLLWPSGFTARHSGSKLEVLDSRGTVTAQVNSSVTVGGGFVSAQDATLSVEDDPTCTTRPSFWVDTIRTP